MPDRIALSPSFTDVSNAVGLAQPGETVRIPHGAATWGATDATGFLSFAKDISIVGGYLGGGLSGMDEGNAIPDPANATIITVTHPTGKCILATYQGTENVCRLSGIVFEITTAGISYLISLQGRCYRRRNSIGVVVGGLRVDHLRFRNTADASPFSLSQKALIMGCGGQASGSGSGTFISGSIDHNFVDYQVGTQGSEVTNFGCTGSPLAADQKNGTADGYGQYQWSQDYTYGGGDDSELLVTYIEDNIFHKSGVFFDTLCGGGRFVVRYNTSWAQIGSHGIDGSNNGPASRENYNNWYDATHGTSTFAMTATRGGATVLFNNRFTTTHSEIASQNYRHASALSSSIGPATGRNFLDENYTGTLPPFNGAGGNAVPLRGGTIKDETNDNRLGSVYARSTSNNVVAVTGFTAGTKYDLVGLDSSALGTDYWAGFTIVNTTIAGDGSSGDQGKNGTSNGQISGYINASTAANPTRISVTSGANANFNLTSGQNWEIRRVKTYFQNPGTGRVIPTSGQRNADDASNGGAGLDTSGYYFIAANGDGKHKYWSNPIQFGNWQALNLTRTASSGVGSTFGPLPDVSTAVTLLTTVGGWHNGSLPTYKKNDNRGDVLGNPYPTRLNNADNNRIGAHWQAPGWTEGINYGATSGAVQSYGAAYPNAMVSGTISPPSITSALTAAGTVGSPFSYTITASNSPTGYDATVLPSSLGVDKSTGVISGTPDGQPATYSVTISASNGGGAGSATLVITLSGLGAGKRGKGVSRRIGSGSRRL